MTDRKKIGQAWSQDTLSGFVDHVSREHELLCLYSWHSTYFAHETHFFHLHCRGIKAKASEQNTSGNKRSKVFHERCWAATYPTVSHWISVPQYCWLYYLCLYSKGQLQLCHPPFQQQDCINSCALALKTLSRVSEYPIIWTVTPFRWAVTWNSWINDPCSYTGECCNKCIVAHITCGMHGVSSVFISRL